MKTVIITGGNSGLGYCCAQKLAQDPSWYIVIACRNLEKAQRAVKRIQEIGNSQQIEAMTLDLASLASVRSFTAKFAGSNLPPLSAVICNAGVQFIQRQTYTQEGFDTTFGVNHLGHFLLVHLLLKQLVAPARIVFVSSDTHDSSKTTGMPAPYWRDPQLMAYPEQDPILKNKNIGIVGRTAYTTSKLCNILCAYELSRRLQQQGKSTASQPIAVNVFNPGLMPGSGLAQDYTPVAKFVWHNILPILSKFIPNVNTIEQAGTALARLIADPELAGVTGKYFSGFEMTNSSTESYDQEKARQLWNASVELTQLKPEETIL
ncbi:SDR family NAD(P)-dependent oxidoreductase [Pleurocapsales cyanobacterium LEGE 10410]|nr:SDR family NAD(P)-dependent oxidoreductase [Pleurocapsales cyanobacterium LEGE 10410]